jgi:predicted alpha/beta hydrolase family esterase
MDKYYEDLQFLVEHTVNMTKKKAILFGHSMGNIVINRFLREKVDAVNEFGGGDWPNIITKP